MTRCCQSRSTVAGGLLVCVLILKLLIMCMVLLRGWEAKRSKPIHIECRKLSIVFKNVYNKNWTYPSAKYEQKLQFLRKVSFPKKVFTSIFPAEKLKFCGIDQFASQRFDCGMWKKIWWHYCGIRGNFARTNSFLPFRKSGHILFKFDESIYTGGEFIITIIFIVIMHLKIILIFGSLIEQNMIRISEW